MHPQGWQARRLRRLLAEGYSYRNQWWISGDANGVFMTRGIMGQSIYVDPTAEVLIVRFTSNPVWRNNFNDPTAIPGFAAIADHLMKA
jgi:CubicO group peptidase (beta-lactamase class C family)